MSKPPKSAPEASVSTEPTSVLGTPRSIHPNVSLTRVDEVTPDQGTVSREEFSRASTASSVDKVHGSTPHPNVSMSRTSDLNTRSQQTSWAHPNVRSNCSKRNQQASQCSKNINNCRQNDPSQTKSICEHQGTSTLQQISNCKQCVASSCSQTSQTAQNNCVKFSQSKQSSTKSACCGGKDRPISKCSRQKSMKQLKIVTPCDSFNQCDNSRSSTKKLATKSSSCHSLGRNKRPTIPASAKSSCMSIDVCSDCRDAYSAGSSATSSCQSLEGCKDCGISKQPPNYPQTSSCGASRDLMGVCSDCATNSKSQHSNCQSMNVCSYCRAAGQSPSGTNSCQAKVQAQSKSSCQSMNQQSSCRAVQAPSSSKPFNGGSSCNSRGICGECSRNNAASSRLFEAAATHPNHCGASQNSVRARQQNGMEKQSCQSMNVCSNFRMATQAASCASCSSKKKMSAKKSMEICKDCGHVKLSPSKVNFKQSKENCNCQSSDTDLELNKNTSSVAPKPSMMSQGTQKSLCASQFTQTEAIDEDNPSDSQEEFECQSAEFCDECGGLPECNEDLTSFSEDEKPTKNKVRQRSLVGSPGKRKKQRNTSAKQSKTSNLCPKQSMSNLPGPCEKMQQQSMTDCGDNQLKSANPCMGLKCAENPCAAYQQLLSRKCPRQKPQDQPKAESPCAKLKQDRQSTIKVQPKSAKNQCKLLEEVTEGCPEATNYEGEKKLLFLRNKDEGNEFQCDPNPCGALDKERAEMEENARKKREEMKARALANLGKIVEPADEEPKAEHSDECPGDNNDCNDIEKQLNPKKFCKKYQKMRYEIEMQNFTIDKMNRQLQMKIMKCCPQTELQALKQNLDEEVGKLREMIRFAIDMQRENQNEIWGPIPISTQSKDDNKSQINPPQIPLSISQLSGFEELEDIMYGCTKKTCPKPAKPEVQKSCQPQVMRCEEGIRCEDLFTGEAGCPKSAVNSCATKVKACAKSPMTSCADDEVEQELKEVTDSMKNLMSNVASMKCKIKMLKNDFSTLKPGKANKKQKCC